MTAKKKPETAKRATRGGGKPGLRFYQLDIDFDDRRIRYSNWGSVQLRFVGRKEIIYFNLAVEGTWAVRNVPVQSKDQYRARWLILDYQPENSVGGDRVS